MQSASSQQDARADGRTGEWTPHLDDLSWTVREDPGWTYTEDSMHGSERGNYISHALYVV